MRILSAHVYTWWKWYKPAEDDTHHANDIYINMHMNGVSEIEVVCIQREGKGGLVLGDGWPAMNPHTVDACVRLLGFLSLKLYYLICLHESGGADLYSDVVLCRTLVSPQFCLTLLLDMERQFVCGRERESYIDRTQSTSKACEQLAAWRFNVTVKN